MAAIVMVVGLLGSISCTGRAEMDKNNPQAGRSLEKSSIVEYHKLRPRELVKRRQDMPVAYLALGILEWHGLHNPLGLDGVKAHVVLEHLANKVGGVVMPPLFWGDHRGEICELVFDPKVVDWLPPGTADHASEICDFMQLSRSRLQEEAQRSDDEGGWRLWEELVVHIFSQIESLGFELIVAYPGHYPLRPRLQNAITAYKSEGGKARVFVLEDQLVGDGDHAARFETSLLLYLAPDLVNLNELSEDDDYHLGVMGEDPLKHASKEYGKSIVDQFERIIREQIAPYQEKRANNELQRTGSTAGAVTVQREEETVMKSVQHIAFNCRDMQAQEQFYTKHFGFRRARVFNPDTPNEFIILRLGSTCIELFSAPAEAKDKMAKEQPIGFQHLAFEVPDLERALAALHADGIETDEIIDCSSIIPGMRVCFFRDPDGNRVELMEGYRDQSEE
jgi:creatinine amidohydrolase